MRQFECNFQLHRHPQRQTRHPDHAPHRQLVRAKHIAQQIRCRIRDPRLIEEVPRRCYENAQPHYRVHIDPAIPDASSMPPARPALRFAPHRAPSPRRVPPPAAPHTSACDPPPAASRSETEDSPSALSPHSCRTVSAPPAIRSPAPPAFVPHSSAGPPSKSLAQFARIPELTIIHEAWMLAPEQDSRHSISDALKNPRAASSTPQLHSS